MMVDLKLDALYREVFIESLLKRPVSKKVNREFVLVGGTARANPT